VWLPPLGDSPAVNDLLPVTEWDSPGNLNGRLMMPVGVVDRPYDQRRDVLTVDLSGAEGNFVVIGGPQSGKSTTLRTLIMAAAATHTPEQIQFYCLDFGGGTLGSLAKLPHVGSVAGRMDADRVRRTVAEVSSLLRRRETLFREAGVESMRDFRRRKAELADLPAPDAAAEPLSADPYGDVVLVVDGWSSIRSDFEILEPQLQSIAVQGLSYGIHLAVSATRWMEIRPAVKDMLGTRVELRLGDPVDSEMGRKVAEVVPIGTPGRGVSRDKLHLLVGLPRLDSRSTVDDLPEGVSRAAEAVAARYLGRRAPQVRMLPQHLERAAVLQAARRRGLLGHGRIAIGIDEAELAPVVLDFDAQPHLVVLADVECGKTNLLRNVAAGILENSTPDQAQVFLVDYRRSLLGSVETEHLGGYATAMQSCGDLMINVAETLAGRLPPPEVTQQQLRDRSWWSGPDLYVLVDDYDLVAVSTMNHPLAPIAEYLPQARDIGLRVVVTRRSGGAGRAIFDPFLGRLRDLSCNALIMSGSREEGALFGGVKATEMPPGRGYLVSRTTASGVVQLARMEDL
jgi:S-DNA-T family DNA segregation ATPase FtsK/SpoIIIE